MKKKFLAMTMVGLFLAISLVLTSCGSAPAASAQSTGPQLRVTISGIPQEYAGKFGFITMDTGSSRNDPTVAWAMGNIGSGSITFNILDWVTDKAYNKTGNYYLAFLIYEDMDAVGGDQLWMGIIMSKDIGEATSIDFTEFVKM